LDLQVFVFVTIAKFGALNCALIGLGRKILSLVLSFVLYGHTMNAIQTVGLTLSLIAMIANFYEKVGISYDVSIYGINHRLKNVLSPLTLYLIPIHSIT
jgi:drug/metabolite transporter (DMT)-like permease